jgi:DNA gyrase subunit A
MGRPATGVRGVDLEGEDEVVSLAIVQDKGGMLLTVTENGYGKRTPVDEYRLQGRGGSGIITIQTTTRNGRVVGVREVREDDEVIVSSTKGMVIRIPVSTVSVLGRNVQGNRIMKLDNGDKVMALARLARDELPVDVAQEERRETEAALRDVPVDTLPPTPPAETGPDDGGDAAEE